MDIIAAVPPEYKKVSELLISTKSNFTVSNDIGIDFYDMVHVVQCGFTLHYFPGIVAEVESKTSSHGQWGMWKSSIKYFFISNLSNHLKTKCGKCTILNNYTHRNKSYDYFDRKLFHGLSLNFNNLSSYGRS